MSQPVERASAQAHVCHALIVIDRSNSVDDDERRSIIGNIQQLFDPVNGLNNAGVPPVKLAFWSFSTIPPEIKRGESYDQNFNFVAPLNGFVDVTTPINSDFDRNLNGLIDSTFQRRGTSYEEALAHYGFGYNRAGDPRDHQLINPHQSVKDIIAQTDIIAMVSDGAPNTPGTPQESNPATNSNMKPLQAAVAAAKKLNKPITGGVLKSSGTAGKNSMAYITRYHQASPNWRDHSDTFEIDENYGNLTAVLKAAIIKKCSEVVPPQPVTQFNLTPVAIETGSGEPVAGSGSASFTFSINNSPSTGTSENINWRIHKVILDRGEPTSSLEFNEDFRDGFNCFVIRNLIHGNGRCFDTPEDSGSGRFTPGSTSIDDQVDDAINELQIDDGVPIGSSVCFILVVDKPTHNNSPRDRYSRAACVSIGKRPTVRIQGGDLRVGRLFNDDDATVDAKIATSKTSKADGRTYGSWVEYGAMAPGPITGIASLSGLQGGAANSDQSAWSKLTFANDPGYGGFDDDNFGLGTIADYSGAIKAIGEGYSDDKKHDLTGSSGELLTIDEDTEGFYTKTNGDLDLGGGTVGKSKTIIVNAPNHKVTITGNIGYADEEYSNIDEIPQLVIIAKDIEIEEDVVTVDAWLIASDSVKTCDKDNLTILKCRDRLTINGPIMAEHLSLRRTGGSGTSCPTPDNPPQPNESCPANDPAEIINLRGDSYLWALFAGHNDLRAQTTFSTELPPYF